MNELERLVELSSFHLDYTKQVPELRELSGLAARIAGADMSLVNIIDRYKQWTIARHGSDMTQMDREDSACQYTIHQDAALELKGLKEYPRFMGKSYVCGGPELNYYYGIPLATQSGARIGALCVLDHDTLELTREQISLLDKLAGLVVHRLESIKQIRRLSFKLREASRAKRKVAHDVCGPIAGIIGVVDLLRDNINPATRRIRMDYFA